MRDFDWHDELYCVVKEDGTFAGVPCRSIEEAIELSGQHEGSMIYEMKLDNESLWGYTQDEDEYTDYDPYEDIRSWERKCEQDIEYMMRENEDYNYDDDTGYDPYMGCYTDEC